MNRRVVIAGFGSVLAQVPFAGWGQQTSTSKVPRIGILSPAETWGPTHDEFLKVLRTRGYEEGRNIVFERRLFAGNYTAVPSLVAELANLPVDIIVVTGGTGVAQQAAKGTKSIPIISVTSGVDPVDAGLAKSRTHPGGNVTGFLLHPMELNAKRIEILRAIAPGAMKLVVLLYSQNALSNQNYLATREAAVSMGMSVDKIEVGSVEALRLLRPDAFPRGSAVSVMSDSVFANHRKTILALIAAARVPAIYPEREFAEDGGLVAYGTNVADNYRRAAEYVDLILKGAKVGDLPIQAPVKFDYVINLKTAKTLGLTVPDTLLARADEVIE